MNPHVEGYSEANVTLEMYLPTEMHHLAPLRSIKPLKFEIHL